MFEDLDIIEELNDIALFIFDLDGVIYRGDVLINHSNLIIKILRNKGIDVVFNTNNSTANEEVRSNKCYYGATFCDNFRIF